MCIRDRHTDNLPELLENDMFEVNSSQQSFDDKSPIHYQYKGKYIMTAVKSGLLVVDQYRAHIRVLYDKYMMQISGNENASQKVLFPEVISFTPSETILLDSIMTDLEKLGFDLTSLGGGSYSVSGVPAGIEGVDYVKLLKSFVDKASDCEQTSLTSDIHAMIALKMARSAAIPYGQILGNAEMENLINELFASSDVNHTPDGKLIISILKQSDIDNLFV